MICFYCKAEVKVPDYAWHNAMNQDKGVLVAMPCCQKPVIVERIQHINIKTTETDRTHDDWGNPFNKDKT